MGTKRIVSRLLDIVLRKRFSSASTIPYYYIRGYQKKKDISLEVEQFSKLATEIIEEGRSLLHFDRLYTLFQVAQRLPANCTAIEIGVFRGGTSKFLSQLFSDKEIQLVAIDTFEGHKDSSVLDGNHRNNMQFSDNSFDEVRNYLSGYPNTIVHKTRCEDFDFTSIDKIDFIHLDVDTYNTTAWVLENLTTKMSSHSVCIIDDYGNKTTPGVERAVKEFIFDKENFFLFHLITGQALLMKL